MELFIPYLIPEEIYLLREDLDPDVSTQETGQNGPDDHPRQLLNQTIFLVSQKKEVELSPEIQDLLIKIVHAIHLTLEDIILIPVNDHNTEVDPLADYQMKDCRLIGFLESVPKKCQPAFDPQKYILKDMDNFISLLADSLEEIDRDRSRKVILWKKLKELYQLK
jgi:hypothetical protein